MKKFILNILLMNNLSYIIFCLSLLLYIFVVRMKVALWLMPDLKMYYIAGQEVLSGHNVYLFGQTYANFLYTPFTALLFSHMAHFSLETLKLFMAVLSLISLLLSVWISLELLGYKENGKKLKMTFAASAFLLWLEPVQQTLLYGQINLILMLLIMLGFLLVKNKYLCGLFIGIAASIKLTPAIFIVYLFMTRRITAGVIALLVVAFTIVIGFIVLPASSKLYWSGLFLDTSRIGDVRLVGDQSLNGSFSRITGNIAAAKPYSFIASIFLGILGLSLAAYAGKRNNELLGILLCAITGLLISPLSWSHHWIWLSLLLLYLIRCCYAKSSLTGTAIVIVLFILCCWFTPLIPNLSSFPHIIAYKPPKIHEIVLLQQNPYVLIGIFFLFTTAFVFISQKKEILEKSKAV